MTDKIDTTIHRAELAGYSSVVGQPIMLLNKAGACIGQLSLIGAQGDYKAMTAEVAVLINGDAIRAEVEQLRAALNDLLEWDKMCGCPLPYAVINPLLAALKGGYV